MFLMSMFPSPWLTVSVGLHSEDVTHVQLSTVRNTGLGVTTGAGAGAADGGRDPKYFYVKKYFMCLKCRLLIITLANRSTTW